MTNIAKKEKIITFTDKRITDENIDKDLFVKACEKIVGRQIGLNGIGTLKEKTVHAVLKYYYAPKEAYHEIKIDSFVADICREGEIYEIQSRSFNVMRRKLSCFLEHHDVTIVYPIPYIKYIRWIDVDTGEISKTHKSPKKGKLYDIIPELYKIKEFLKNENLHFILVFVNMEEYKLLDGWSKDKKKGATKSDRIPTDIIGEFYINEKKDYLKFLPEEILSEENLLFTTKDLAKAAKCPVGYAQVLLHILHHLELVERKGKQGNSYLYKIL